MHKLAVSVIFLLGLSLPLAAQQPAAASPEATHFDFSGGLSLMRSNAPPGTCGCFTLYGASGSAALNLNSWLGIVGDVGYVRDSSITSSDRSLSILSYLLVRASRCGPAGASLPLPRCSLVTRAAAARYFLAPRRLSPTMPLPSRSAEVWITRSPAGGRSAARWNTCRRAFRTK